MALTYYGVTASIEDNTNPDTHYRNNLQSNINRDWINTTTLYDVEEEIELGTLLFKTVNVRVNHVVVDGITTGMKNGDDFRKIIYQDINYPIKRGIYYKFADNYWLSYFTDEFESVAKDTLVRRCNNYLKWKNEEDGSIISYPCIIDYDVTSPSPLQDKDIITANNHARIIVQGNVDTRKILVNQRFIFNQRAYKVTGYNNDLEHDIESQTADILYFDVYLDTISPNDDLVNSVANNNEYEYTIKINQSSFTQEPDYTTQLTTSIFYNELIVEKDVTWLSLNANASVDDDGNITLTGESGSTAQILVYLNENKNVSDTINIEILDALDEDKVIVIEPQIEKLLQGRSVTINANVYENNVIQSDTVTVETSGANTDNYNLVSLGDNQFALHNIRVTGTPLILTFTSDDITTEIEIELGGIF